MVFAGPIGVEIKLDFDEDETVNRTLTIRYGYSSSFSGFPHLGSIASTSFEVFEYST